MKCLMLPVDGEPYLEDLPESHRGSLVQKVGPQVGAGPMTMPLVHAVLTFRWTGQIARKSGTPVLDVFEEEPC